MFVTNLLLFLLIVMPFLTLCSTHAMDCGHVLIRLRPSQYVAVYYALSDSVDEDLKLKIQIKLPKSVFLMLCFYILSVLAF